MVDAKDQPWFKGSYYEKLVGTRFLYDHGLPFRQLHADNIDDMMGRIKKKKASLMVYDGGVGEGKTTMAVHTADYINIKHGNGQPIDFRGPQLALGGNEFGEKILVCHDKKLLVIIYDEAGDLDKKTTLSRFNRNIMRIFEMYRGFAILVILCLPRFYKLENELLDLGVWRLTLHCEDRTERQGNFRVFDIEQTYYIKHHATKIIVKPKCYDYGMSNYHGHFLDLPPERSKDLDAVSIAAKRKETKKTVHNVNGMVSYLDIAKHFGKSTRWVEMKIKKLGTEAGESKMYDKTKYFDKAIIEKIDSMEE